MPQAGDIIIYDWDGDGGYSHVGIVYDCDGVYVYTIEGNAQELPCTQTFVERKKRSLNYSSIVGYVRSNV